MWNYQCGHVERSHIDRSDDCLVHLTVELWKTRMVSREKTHLSTGLFSGNTRARLAHRRLAWISWGQEELPVAERRG